MKKRMVSYVLICMAGLTLSGCASKTALFNGRNLDGWKMYLQDKTIDPAAVWSVSEGVIHCAGKPNGYLRTVKDYSNYKLHLEWRWTENPTNSGVLLHATGEDKLWPLCIEAQLQNQNAGDFVTIQKGSAITVDGVRHQPDKEFYHIVPKQHPSNEKEPSQWNSYDIICKNNTIKVYVNGLLQNAATDTSLRSGAICLQSEGSPIEFRNIILESIP